MKTDNIGLEIDPEVAGLSFETLTQMMLSPDRDIAMRAAGEILERAFDLGVNNPRDGRSYDLGGNDKFAIHRIVIGAMKRSTSDRAH